MATFRDNSNSDVTRSPEIGQPHDGFRRAGSRCLWIRIEVSLACCVKVLLARPSQETCHVCTLCASWLTIQAVANGTSGEPSRLRFGLVWRTRRPPVILARSASGRAPHPRFDRRNSAGLDGGASHNLPFRSTADGAAIYSERAKHIAPRATPSLYPTSCSKLRTDSLDGASCLYSRCRRGS